MTIQVKIAVYGGEWGNMRNGRIWSRWIGNRWLRYASKKWTNMSSAKSFLSSGARFMAVDHDPAGLRGLMRIIITKYHFIPAQVCVTAEVLVVVCNFSAEAYHDYRIGFLRCMMQESAKLRYGHVRVVKSVQWMALEVESIPLPHQKYSIRITFRRLLLWCSRQSSVKSSLLSSHISI